MQENRSFDSYFGTFPGANGIPMSNGVPAVCAPDPRTGTCVKPYHTTYDLNRGGPHTARAAVADINGGRMDGFISTAENYRGRCRDPDAPNCAGTVEVMAYHDGRELANYWKYAHDYVLQDHLFEPNASWSLPQHLFMVSAWSAYCAHVGDPMSCGERAAESRLSARFQRAQAARPRAGTARLCVDRYHLSVACPSRQLELLRDGGHGARLRQRLRFVRERSPEGQNAGHLEPASVFRYGEAQRRSRQHSRLTRLLRRGPEWDAGKRRLALPSRRVQRASARARQSRSGLRHWRDQCDHAQSGLEQHRDLSNLGRLGRPLRSRGAARTST